MLQILLASERLPDSRYSALAGMRRRKYLIVYRVLGPRNVVNSYNDSEKGTIEIVAKAYLKQFIGGSITE